jgi:hypothetical protein
MEKLRRFDSAPALGDELLLSMRTLLADIVIVGHIRIAGAWQSRGPAPKTANRYRELLCQSVEAAQLRDAGGDLIASPYGSHGIDFVSDMN